MFGKKISFKNNKAIIRNDSPAVQYQQTVRQYRNETFADGDVASTQISTNLTF